MKAFIFIIMLIGTVLFPLERMMAQTTLSDFNTIFEQHKNAVVLVSTYTLDGTPLSQGSGFVVRPEGYIITNYHVIIGACSVQVKLENGHAFSVQRVAVHRTNDVALLKVDARDLHALSLGGTHRINAEDSVLVISNPGGLQNISSRGKVIRETRGTTFEIDAVVSRGSSGGPVLSANGIVVGFIVAGIENSLRNTAIVSDEANVLLASALLKPETMRSLDELCSRNCQSAEHYYDIGATAAIEGRFDEALQDMNVVLQMCPTYADAYVRIAQAYQELGFYQLAVLNYSTAIENAQHLRDKSVLPTLYFNRGVSNLNINMHNEATADFERVKRDPVLGCKATYNLFVAYYNSDQCDLAISNFHAADSCEHELISPCNWTSLGYCYSKLGQLDKAETTFGRAISLGCTEARSWKYLSQIHLQKWDTLGAVGALEDGVKHHREDADLWLQLGDFYFELKKYEKAIEAYSATVRIQPENESARYNRCVCYLNLAIQYLAHNRFSPCLSELEKVSECDALKERVSDLRFEVYSRIGVEQLRNGNCRAAIDTFKLAVGLRRKACGVWFNLGLAHDKCQENAEALIALTQAVEVGDDSCKALAYLQRGIVHRRIKEHQKSIDDFKKALVLGSHEAAEQICWTFVNIGEEHLQNRRFREAVAFADSALKYDTCYASSFVLRAQGWMRMEEPWKARTDLEYAIRCDGSMKRAFCVIAQVDYNIGITNFNQGKYRAAEDTLKLSIGDLSACDEPRLQKGTARSTWYGLAKVYMETGRHEEAVDAFSRAIEADPEYPLSWCGRGEARYKLKQFVDAREDLQHAVKLNRDYARAHGFLLECCLELRDFDGACTACRELERLRVNDAQSPCRARIQEKLGKRCPK